MEPPDPDVLTTPLSRLSDEEKARRAGSFGQAAADYDRYRPGPCPAAVDWLLPGRAARVVDLGAGTGALTRLLVARAGEVIAVEPDARMRAVLAGQVPGARVVDGRAESMPLPNGWADAVLASASWHWVDPDPALAEVARVLAPGGILGAVWAGPDPEGPFLARAMELLASLAGDQCDGGTSEIAALLLAGDARRPHFELEIPAGSPFSPPDHEVFRWDAALTADDLVGMLRTMSWVITMPDDRREQLLGQARRLLGELLGVEGDVTVDVTFRADAWRSRNVTPGP